VGKHHTWIPCQLFLKNFNGSSLVDIAPDVLVLTWRNGRRGAASISKRLDRIYVVEYLLARVCRYKSWVDFPYISDHAPVLLRLDRLTLLDYVSI
jgi:endonuclease/exonuclease/phosphatase family metal-dependent hydrolase